MRAKPQRSCRWSDSPSLPAAPSQGAKAEGVTSADDLALFLIQKKSATAPFFPLALNLKALRRLEVAVPQGISAVSVLDISQKVLEISQSWFSIYRSAVLDISRKVLDISQENLTQALNGLPFEVDKS